MLLRAYIAFTHSEINVNIYLPHSFDNMKLVVGLGNPGKKYERTRHNVGFLVLDTLHEKLKSEGISQWDNSKKFSAEIAGCTYKNEKIVLAKPQTYMNDSGLAVRQIAHFYKLTVRDLIVVHDDKDILLGEIKIQKDRGSAGHNGVKSLIEHLGTQDFVRIRVGVRSSNEKKMQDTAKFVLGKFGIFEKKTLNEILTQSAEKILNLI